jgi:hypothetical protein
MRTILILAAALVLAAPSLASANGCVTGSTVAGGVGGALIGNSLAKGGAGAVLGGLGGALVGNSVAKANCGRERRVAAVTTCHWTTQYRDGVAHRVRMCRRT